MPPRLAVRDVTALLQVRVSVAGAQFDASVMEHPEFLLATAVVFQCAQLGGTQLQARWRVWRSFPEFQGLDSQLRRAFPQEMRHQTSPPRHRRRTFLKMHRGPKFLAARCAELNAYLEKLLQQPRMRLTRFLDPCAPLLLRCFCDFDAGFEAGDVSIRPNQLDRCVLSLQPREDGGDGSNGASKRFRKDTARTVASSDEIAMNEGENRQEEDGATLVEDQQRLSESQRRRVKRRRSADSTLDALQSNLLDDRARNLAMCLKYECACRVSPFRVTHSKMTRMLRLRGFKQTYAPPEGALTALYCVLFKLQQFNDLDKRLYDALTGFPTAPTKPQEDGGSERPDALANNQLQLSVSVELLRQTLGNYGLLHVNALERHFRTSAVDLKRKLHEFKARRQLRVGALELVLLATMLDLSILLISNDHEGSEQLIQPLSGLRPIRQGGRIDLTLGYILPTLVCVNGFYLLAEQKDRDSLGDDDEQEQALLSEQQRRRMWLGVDEMDRCFMGEIERTLQDESQAVAALAFDFDAAETLNTAILDAVWDDCQHNPNLFYLFQRQARQFGKARTTARFFLQYLEVAFGLEGAAYLVDFLLHVLPEQDLRKQLLSARWMRLHGQLAKRVSP
ncbi:hypothetical protein BBJ28_00015791 [Nothophytophthora sp. Chile5]|nr:hypothetical protein BBJ28_00015791 [Nothophytophthora sp. Chile5]